MLEIKALCYFHPDGTPLLKGVNLSLEAGERHALLGDNGAGKSTLMQLIMGLRKASSGEIYFDGSAIKSKADFKTLRQKLGFVFQDPDDQLFSPTVIEDLAFGPLNLGQTPSQAIQASEALLDELNIIHLKNRISHKLSGGEKRLVALASVLVMKPKALILDEPSNALDRSNRLALIDVLKALPLPLLIVSHDADFVEQLATRKSLLKGGHVEPF